MDPTQLLTSLNTYLDSNAKSAGKMSKLDCKQLQMEQMSKT